MIKFHVLFNFQDICESKILNILTIGDWWEDDMKVEGITSGGISSNTK